MAARPERAAGATGECGDGGSGGGDGGARPFEVAGCLDFGAFDPRLPDHGVDAFLERTLGLNGWLVLMEDREPDFFLAHRDYAPDATVPLNRHGPHDAAWTMQDLRGLVATLRERGVPVWYGAWMHECRWVDERHPELLMRAADGETWRDERGHTADFNPLKRLRGDDDVPDGTPFVDVAVRQWRRLARDFGFTGLFVGDGGMGYRRFGHDALGIQWYDYDRARIADFRASPHHATHDGCALERDDVSAPDAAADVRAHHWQAWTEWNVDEWTAFYAALAHGVHGAGGRLGAYNVMNYGPALAREHGVDYARLAEAGLDVLVFQTYDYAWGPHGPFHLPKKDLLTNLLGILETSAALQGTDCKLYWTTEAGDAVEGWDAPLAHTLGEVHAYGGARRLDPDGWRPAADGTLIVWANGVPKPEWALIRNALRQAGAHTGPQGGVLEILAPRRAAPTAPAGDADAADDRYAAHHQEAAALLARGIVPDGVTVRRLTAATTPATPPPRAARDARKAQHPRRPAPAR